MIQPNVSYTIVALQEALKRYTVIRDCVAGDLAIKAKTTTYLPMPNEGSPDIMAKRYKSYLLRAVFYNVTKRTLDGLCGQIFMREPFIELPAKLAALLLDADGSGVSLVQVAKRAAHYGVGYGRAGVFVDYPSTDAPLTVAAIERGDIRPTITVYAPWQVINWRTTIRGARKLLSLVVIEEEVDSEVSTFATSKIKQWRVLQLIDDVYTVQLWRLEKGGKHEPFVTFVPRDSVGNTLSEIPFQFIGAYNNDEEVDDAPLYDIATMNIAHYRNSADYEESCFMVGQPTPVLAGLTEDWVKNVLEGTIVLGSRSAVMLPVGGTAILLQASPNQLPAAAMEHKEKQMVALGARIVEQRAVVRTATEAGFDHTTEGSVLSSVAKNVSACFTWALGWCARFAGAEPTAQFMLNTDFDIATLTPEARRQLILEWQSGAITWDEVRLNLHKSGVASTDDAEARIAIDAEQAALAATEQARTLTKQPTTN